MAGVFSAIRPFHPSLLRNEQRATAISPPSISGFGVVPRHPNPSRVRHARLPRHLRASIGSSDSSVAVVAGDSARPPDSLLRLTYLEGNSWLWDVGGVRVLVDPILVGNLDFGIPWLYDAAKRFLKKFQLKDLPELDCLLITQSLDDHCHIKTLKPLSEQRPDICVVATPNAESILSPLFKNITYLEPGQKHEFIGRNGLKVSIEATSGPILGPPWQRPENGYIVRSGESVPSVYYEPHCVYDSPALQKGQADVVITPVVKQMLPSFTLVSGQEDAVRLAKLLKAKFVVVMNNGDLDSKGILSALVKPEGTVQSFKDLISREMPDACVLEPTPGVALNIPATLSVS
ncbi:metallo-hydrolase/oxidoreductase superfamily protein [Wolffia australiana]